MKNTVKWKVLLDRIKNQTCTPFLGSETCSGTVPPASELAERMARAYDYPVVDGLLPDLARVAQYVATIHGLNEPKKFIANEIKAVRAPDFKRTDDPHGLLASLPLPVYVTTTYFDFISDALRQAFPVPRDPVVDRCRWSRSDRPETLFAGGFTPTPANPLVYHLHGHYKAPESIVLTEDDYLDFLARTSENPELIPDPVRAAFTEAALLFLGFRLTDMEFRVLLRSIIKQLEINGYRHMMTVQVIAVGGADSGEGEEDEAVAAMMDYLKRYCDEFHIDVYWGSFRDFVTELRQRWEAFQGAGSLTHV